MGYLKNYKTLEQLDNIVTSRPGVITIEKPKNVYYIPDQGYLKSEKVTLKARTNNKLGIEYLKTTITCSEDTTLSVYYTKESWLSEIPDEIIRLKAGDNIWYIYKLIYRIDILVYSRTTGSRVSGNTKITGIILEGSIEDGYRLFDNGSSFLKNLSKIDVTELDTYNVRSLFCCFQSHSNLTFIGNLSSWDVSNVTSIRSMFFGLYNLTSIGELSEWNVSKIIDMRTTFWNCFELTSLGDLSGWNAPHCLIASGAFGGYEGTMKLTSLDLTNLFKNGVVTDLSTMFQNCSNLTQVGDLSEWNVSNVTGMKNLFNKCFNLTSVGDLSRWDIFNVTDMTQMFCKCENLTSLGDLSSWNAPKCTTAYGMFAGKNQTNTEKYPTKFTRLSLSNLFKNGIINDLGFMFYGNSNLTYVGDLSIWDVSNVTVMRSMFSSCLKLTSIGDISDWNVSKVTDMSFLFNCTNCVNGLDLSSWNTSNVTTMLNMFNSEYTNEITGPVIASIGIPPIPKGCDTSFMFYKCKLTTILGCGKISSSVNFEYCPLTKESALIIINTLDQDNPGTLKLSSSTYSSIQEDLKSLETTWTIAV